MYLGAIDEGTTSTRFLITDKRGNPIVSKQKDLTRHHPAAGFSEQDAVEIWEQTKLCMEECMQEASLKCGDLAGIGITNQRETTVVWNKYTGKPCHNAIVWNDNRTTDICERLLGNNSSIFSSENDLPLNKYKGITGLPLAPYFSATKLMYLLENVPNLRDDAEKGIAIFGTIDSWLVFNLTGGKCHVTDVTNASRTLLMDLATCSWCPKLAAEFNIPLGMLPTIVPSASVVGTVAESSGIGGISCMQGVLISGILGDQQSALFGQACYNVGDIKVTYGTGAFLLMNTGTNIVNSKHGLITTVAYQLSATDKPVYALEGSVAYAGATMQWCRDSAHLITNTSQEAEQFARNAAICNIDDYAVMEADSPLEKEQLYFVPAFSGLFAPHWRSDARGLIIGLTAFHTRDHIVRAALESTAFSVMEVIHAMREDIGSVSTAAIRVDGGMCKNGYLMQFQSNLLNSTLHVPCNTANMTAMGAIFAAGIGCGLYTSSSTGSSTDAQRIYEYAEELGGIWKLSKEFNSHIHPTRRGLMISDWSRAVKSSYGWANKEISK